jgi:glycosyltransferase involved in cell wall biosynthesis
VNVQLYEAAFETLKNGEFKAAVPLLERAARETGYACDVINHAYTLALCRADEKPRLADVSCQVGDSLLQNDPASAMDYFQRAIWADLDPQRVRHIGEIFEAWAAPRSSVQVSEPVERVAHVVGCLLPEHAPARYVKMLAASMNRQGVQSTLFTTEWEASWFFNPAGASTSPPMEIEAEMHIASVEGDFIERAEKIAEAIRTSGIQVAFFHSSLREQITARVAAMRPAPIQINVNHGAEMDADLFDGFIHLFQNAVRRTRFLSHPAEWIPLGSDIESRQQGGEPVSRHSLGLESASTVSATFGNLRELSGSGYLKALAEILNRFPKHFHLFAGEVNVRAMRGVLHAAGVLPRVRFLGRVADVAPLLDTVDLYLAPFPHSGGYSILEAMGAGKPVVVMRFPPDSIYNSGAELVALSELVAPGEADYVAMVDRLLRNPGLRQKHGEALRNRFQAEFRPDRLGERYVGFLRRLMHR